MGWRRTGEGQLRGPRGEALSSERVLARPLDALAGGLHLRVADRDPGRALAAQRWHMGPEAAIAAMAPPLELGLFLHGLELGQGGERIVCPWPLLCPRRTSLIEVGLAILLPIREEQLGLLTLERAGEVQARGAGARASIFRLVGRSWARLRMPLPEARAAELAGLIMRLAATADRGDAKGIVIEDDWA